MAGFRPMMGKLPKNKEFEYVPRYYKPEKTTKRIHFDRKTNRGQGRSVAIYATLLALCIYIIVKANEYINSLQ